MSNSGVKRFHDTRPVGKPRGGWKDFVRRDTAQIVGITGIKTEKNGGVFRGRPGSRRGL
jgi:hypothetical protein